MFTSYGKEDIQSQVSESSKILDTPENDIPVKYDLQRCCEWIMKNNYQTTCLQFPGHLLNDGTSIALYLQKELKRPVYILADTSYGSCCVDEVAAEHVNADSIIHFGHACLSPVMKLPALYIFEKKDLDVKRLCATIQTLQEEVVIFYDDVYHHLYSDLCSVLRGKATVSYLNLHDQNEKHLEVICGRVYTKSSNTVTGVYIGEECVTLLNLVLGLPDFKWFRYSTENGLEEYNLNRNKFLMQRSHLVEKIKAANVLGILIGTLGIKNYLDAADRIKIMAKQRGKKCYTLAVGKPNVAKLANFPEIDVFVLIACQENVLLKDFKDYYKPIVSLFEVGSTCPFGQVELALGDRSYSLGYTSDFRELLPGGSYHQIFKSNSVLLSDSNETSLEIMEKGSGTVIEYAGAQFLANRTWQGLEINKSEIEVTKATKGRSGIAQGYENEIETLIK